LFSVAVPVVLGVLRMSLLARLLNMLLPMPPLLQQHLKTLQQNR